MDLLSSLLGSMTSSTAVDSISQKSGGSSDQVSSLVSAALPLLLGSMTNNASTEKGASSLLNALSQHTSTAPVEEQIKAMGYQSVRLDTFTENPFAQRLYLHNGYESRGYASWRKGKFDLMEKKL